MKASPAELRRMRHQVNRLIEYLISAERALFAAFVKASRPAPAGKKRGRKPAGAAGHGLPEVVDQSRNNQEPRLSGATWEPAP